MLFVRISLRAFARRWAPPLGNREMVGSGGFEPPTSCASDRRSPTELRAYLGKKHGLSYQPPALTVKRRIR